MADQLAIIGDITTTQTGVSILEETTSLNLATRAIAVRPEDVACPECPVCPECDDCCPECPNPIHIGAIASRVIADVYSPALKTVEMVRKDAESVRIYTNFKVEEWDFEVRNGDNLSVNLYDEQDNTCIVRFVSNGDVDALVRIFDANNDTTVAIMHVYTVPTPIDLDKV